ncbi:hypothetical protein VPH35_051669 [Triticum aestivum]
MSLLPYYPSAPPPGPPSPSVPPPTPASVRHHLPPSAAGHRAQLATAASCANYVLRLAMVVDPRSAEGKGELLLPVDGRSLPPAAALPTCPSASAPRGSLPCTPEPAPSTTRAGWQW